MGQSMQGHVFVPVALSATPQQGQPCNISQTNADASSILTAHYNSSELVKSLCLCHDI